MHLYKSRIAWVFIFITFFAFNAYAQEQKDDLTVIKGSQQVVLTARDFEHLKVAKIEVQDPVYGKIKHYAGYWLSDILDLARIHPDANSVYIFTALDGYKARLAQGDLIKTKAKGFVAIADIDAEEGWVSFEHGKDVITPAPYYLVWDIPKDAPTDIQLPWAYQMVEISLVGADEAQENIFPAGDKSPAVIRGYKVFSQNCIACHSLNLQGGVEGPELNVPKNIMEYRNREFLKAFIKNPDSFSAHNKMPVFGDSLSDDSIDDVLDYLTWMGKHKINN